MPLKYKFKITISDFILTVLIIFLLSFWGCKKEVVTFMSPKISISSVSIKTITCYEINVDINLGEGQKIKKAKLVFEDITVLSSPGFEKSIELNDSTVQRKTIKVQPNLINHDYSVKALLETDKYLYSSEIMIIRSIKNNFSFTILELERYSTIDNTIACFLNPGQKLVVSIAYDNQFPSKTVEVKLNGTLSASNTIDFSNYYYGSLGLISGGSVTVPDNTPPGDYEVDIFIDGYKFVANKKIRVLEGKWTEYDNKYPGDKRLNYSHFTIGDKLYLVGGKYASTTLSKSPIWEYDLRAKKWTSKKDFPHQSSPVKCGIFPFQLKFNDEGYVVVRNDQTIELWKYNTTDDSWDKVTNYPGLGKLELTGFIINNELFLGGGIANNGNLYVNDFWSFDLNSGKWEKRGDFKISKYFLFDSFCTNKGREYLFSTTNNLIEYNPETDVWTEKARFTGSVRYGSSLVSFDDNLFLVGGMSVPETWNYYGFNDCWQYSTIKDSWQLKAFLPCYSNRGISFIYDNMIICGLGYITSDANFTDHTFYRFVP